MIGKTLNDLSHSKCPLMRILWIYHCLKNWTLTAKKNPRETWNIVILKLHHELVSWTNLSHKLMRNKAQKELLKSLSNHYRKKMQNLKSPNRSQIRMTSFKMANYLRNLVPMFGLNPRRYHWKVNLSPNTPRISDINLNQWQNRFYQPFMLGIYRQKTNHLRNLLTR